MRFHATVLALLPAALVLSTAAQAEDVITVGAAVSLTGKYSTNGENTRRGYDLALEKVNNAGGVKVGDKAYKLAIKYYDDESTAARGAELVERLIKQDNVSFILGPYGSGPTKAVAPVTEKYRVPMVEANGASRSLFTNGWRYIFATLSTSDQYLASAVSLAAENAEALGKKPSELKVAIIVENDPFSQDVREGVLEDMKKHGMQAVIDDQFPRELDDMTATLTKVKALKPDMLIVSGHEKGAATAVRQIGEQKVNVPILAITHCDSAKIIEKFKATAEYTLCPTQWAPTLSYKGATFGSAMDYANEFKAKYDYSPPYQAAESSAAVLVLADAIQRAGSIDREKVRDALAATDLMTFYGRIKFDETGKNIAKPMALYQVIDQEYKVVAPSKFAETQAVIPRPSM